jgi:hypothetical protein
MSFVGKVLPSEFDYSLYVQESKAVSGFWFAWIPPGESTLRIEKSLPVNPSKAYEWLQEWAERTDPGSKLRIQEARKRWDNRRPGEVAVSPFWR